MCKCELCGKKIGNVYYISGKSYGYNCYRTELARIKLQKEAELKELKNKNQQLKSIAIIDIFKNKNFKDNYNKEFQNSIIDFYNRAAFITQNQLKVVFNKLNEVEKAEYYLTLCELTEFKDHSIRSNALKFIKNDKIDIDINDIRIATLFKIEYFGKQEISLYLVKYKKDGCIYKTIDDKEDLEEHKEDLEDDYITNLVYKLYNFNKIEGKLY